MRWDLPLHAPALEQEIGKLFSCWGKPHHAEKFREWMRMSVNKRRKALFKQLQLNKRRITVNHHLATTKVEIGKKWCFIISPDVSGAGLFFLPRPDRKIRNFLKKPMAANWAKLTTEFTKLSEESGKAMPWRHFWRNRSVTAWLALLARRLFLELNVT